ncbi:MATH domain and coiled-coil domain-containing protein [Salix suchowensis]|nr:MATH domain and coiled-coil domain-containing protein [Salix suchowensis]
MFCIARNLVLYPSGNKSKNVKEHISLYLAMADTSSLPLGWEIHVIFRLFLLDQNKDSYLVIQAGKERRFHGLKLEWGFDEFIQLSTFNDSRYGFLVEDTCVLGAEVFVCRERSRGKGEVLSMTKQPATFKYTWKIENFLKLDEKRQESQIFKFTDKIRWKILLYPKGKILEWAPIFLCTWLWIWKPSLLVADSMWITPCALWIK